MSILPPFVLHRPETVSEALSLVSADDLPFVGGTELLLAMHQGLLRPRSLVDLKRIESMKRIAATPDYVELGGAVTHRRALRHAEVARDLPILKSVLARLGNPRVRAAGTLAGNLVFAEPKSDVIPLLIALDGRVVLESPRGSRQITVADFIVGPYTTAREPDELLTAIRIPGQRDRPAVYEKLQTMERPTVGVAAVRLGTDGATRTRVVVGAAGLMPVIAEGPAETLDPVEIAARVEPIADLTGSPDYKRHVTAVFVERALQRLGSGQ